MCLFWIVVLVCPNLVVMIVNLNNKKGSSRVSFKHFQSHRVFVHLRILKGIYCYLPVTLLKKIIHPLSTARLLFFNFFLQIKDAITNYAIEIIFRFPIFINTFIKNQHHEKVIIKIRNWIIIIARKWIYINLLSINRLIYLKTRNNVNLVEGRLKKKRNNNIGGIGIVLYITVRWKYKTIPKLN